MKILINTKYLYTRMREALLQGCHTIELDRNILTFSHQTFKVELHVHVLENSSEALTINKIGFYRAYRFLACLEEQPAVVEFMYDSIEVSQIIKRFNHDLG